MIKMFVFLHIKISEKDTSRDSSPSWKNRNLDNCRVPDDLLVATNTNVAPPKFMTRMENSGMDIRKVYLRRQT